MRSSASIASEISSQASSLAGRSWSPRSIDFQRDKLRARKRQTAAILQSKSLGYCRNPPSRDHQGVVRKDHFLTFLLR